MSNTWIIIPAYNATNTIVQVIDDVRSAGYENICIIDDASGDDTYKKAKQTGVVVLQHVINRGQGAALQTGNEYALSRGAEVLVHVDADGQMQTADIPTLVTALKTGIDVALGSRYLTAQTSSKSPVIKKYFIHPLGRVINFIFTGLWLTDAHCGFRALTADAARKITITQDRMAHNTEILELIREHKLRFQEVPVTILYHEFGQGFGGGVRIVLDLLKQRVIK